jgi:LacI family transcriptional regulator
MAASGLKHGDAAIAEIAQNCGFKSAQYLHTVFRREFGCTPREFQQGEAAPIH